VSVVPLAAPKLRCSQDTFENKSGFLQRSLLSGIVGMRYRFNPLRWCVVVQVGAEHSLGSPADSAAAPFL
jgi:hypothetical protein